MTLLLVIFVVCACSGRLKGLCEKPGVNDTERYKLWAYVKVVDAGSCV